MGLFLSSSCFGFAGAVGALPFGLHIKERRGRLCRRGHGGPCQPAARGRLVAAIRSAPWCAREVRTGLAVGGNRIRTCMGLFPIGRRARTLRHLASFKPGSDARRVRQPDSGRRRSISARVTFAISPVADGNQCATFVADVRARVSDKFLGLALCGNHV